MVTAAIKLKEAYSLDRKSNLPFELRKGAGGCSRELEARPTLRGVRVQCFQTAKGYGNVSSVRGKKRAIVWILQLLRGCTASAPHGEHEAPCGPILGMQQHAHRMSVFTYVQAYVH